jgi:hypothetical protein
VEIYNVAVLLVTKTSIRLFIPKPPACHPQYPGLSSNSLNQYRVIHIPLLPVTTVAGTCPLLSTPTIFEDVITVVDRNSTFVTEVIRSPGPRFREVACHGPLIRSEMPPPTPVSYNTFNTSLPTENGHTSVYLYNNYALKASPLCDEKDCCMHRYVVDLVIAGINCVPCIEECQPPSFRFPKTWSQPR